MLISVTVVEHDIFAGLIDPFVFIVPELILALPMLLFSVDDMDFDVLELVELFQGFHTHEVASTQN